MKIAVCDDETLMRKNLISFLEMTGGKHCIKEYESGNQLLEADIDFDVVFLDIRMSGITGLEAARILRTRPSCPEIIFVTGLREYVFDAFDVEAFHYLIKPVDQVKFLKVFQRVDQRIRAKKQTLQGVLNAETMNKSILVKTGSLSRWIAIRDIYAVEVINRKVILYTTSGEFEFYGRLSSMETELGDGFFRCHRAYLAAYDYILGYDKESIILKNKMKVPIAKQKYSSFVKAYLNYMKGLE